MSTFKGTPGPWESVGGYVRTPRDTRGGGWVVADCWDSSRPWNEVCANAALIAAALDLLEAARNALQHIGAYGDYASDAYNELETAITKAIGEQA